MAIYIVIYTQLIIIIIIYMCFWSKRDSTDKQAYNMNYTLARPTIDVAFEWQVTVAARGIVVCMIILTQILKIYYYTCSAGLELNCRPTCCTCRTLLGV